MKIPALRSVCAPLIGAILFAAAPLAQEETGAEDAAADAPQEKTGPGPVDVDVFHPAVRAGEAQPAAAYGGRIIVHLSTMPKDLNKVVENSAVVSWIMYEVNDSLLFMDWENWNFENRLAASHELEDTVVLKPDADGYEGLTKTIGRGDKEREVIFGAARLDGDVWKVTPLSEENPLTEEVEIDAADVVSVERGTVFTFHLREGVKWHDGHIFNADDVFFSWDVYNNPEVDCDEIRSYFQKILHGEVLGDLTVRFFYENQYFLAINTIGEMPIIPRHLYDLNDPDNKTYVPDIHAELEADHGEGYQPTIEDRGEFINTNDYNQGTFVGLGPYRITTKDSQYIEAERFEDYWDKDNPRYGGFFDVIRWRYIGDDNTAKQALLNGELDLFTRVKSEDYFGEMVESEQFSENFYAGYYYTGSWGYNGWNLLRPQFEDKNVRHALAHAFDLETYRLTQYKGLAKQVTGPQSYFGPGYDHSLEPLAYDPDLAEELLAEAGWYDRDGDDIIDKDGIAFEFDFLFPSGNDASKTFGRKYQEALAPLGIKMNMRNLEWATFLERVLARDFDSINLAWVSPVESDPEQLWHSKWGQPDVPSSNHSAVMDPVVDDLIERGQTELDPQKRYAIWHELHRYLYDMQPYIFMLNSPRKFAISKNVRGLQTFVIAPGYSLRRLYYPEGTPGTRAQRAGTR